jgi:radical SAM protein with 4Fe4S-binding SPASM domain
MITQEDLPSGCYLSEQRTISDKIKQPCFEVYRRMHVLSNGDVGVCSCRDIEAEINVGNVSQNSLSEIWRGEKLKELRSAWSQGKLPEVCKSCDRYVPVNEYISQHKWSIISTHARRFLRHKSKSNI